VVLVKTSADFSFFLSSRDTDATEIVQAGGGFYVLFFLFELLFRLQGAWCTVVKLTYILTRLTHPCNHVPSSFSLSLSLSLLLSIPDSSTLALYLAEAGAAAGAAAGAGAASLGAPGLV